jgi:flagellar basal body rod protein FlgG
MDWGHAMSIGGGDVYGMQTTLRQLDLWVAALNTQVVGSAIPGYKAERVTFTGGATQIDRLSGGLLRQVGEASMSTTGYIDQGQGDLAASLSRNHMAISGPGFFAVAQSLAAGTPVQYTRDGEFHLDDQGYYRTNEGLYVLSADDVDPQGNVVRNPAQFARTGDIFGPGAQGVTDATFNGRFYTTFQDPPTGGTGGPMNYNVDLGGIGIAYTATAANPTNNAVWSATPMTVGKDAFANVGWTSADTTADAGNGGGSLHYGAHNVATYASGLNRANTVDVLADWGTSADVALHVNEPGGLVTDTADTTNNGRLMQWTADGTVRPGGSVPANNDEWYRLTTAARADNGLPITDGVYTARIDGATGVAAVNYAIVEDYGTIHQQTVTSGTVTVGPTPMNYLIDMGSAGLSTGTGPAAGSWVATAMDTGPSGSVGWMSSDGSAGSVYGGAGSLRFGRVGSTTSYATGADAAGKLDVVVDWSVAADIDLHVYEPDAGNGAEHTYFSDKLNNGQLNRDSTTGTGYPGGPSYTDWDEWYTVDLTSRKDAPGTPSDEGVYNAQIYGYSGAAATVAYQFIADAGSAHQSTISSGSVAISTGQTVDLGSTTMADRRVNGTVWSPEYAINPLLGTTNVAFDYSFALDATGVETNAGLDIMTFQYRTYDQATSSWDGWATATIPKPSTAQGWTTFNQSIASSGKSKVQFAWNFDSVDGKKNNGRGWNLEKLSIQQPTAGVPNATLGSVTAGDRRNSGSVYSPAFNLNPTMTSVDFSFDHSFALDTLSGLEGNAAVDQMKVAYRLNGGAWVYLPTPKSGTSAGWASYFQSIVTSGAANIQFRWDFDTVDGKYNAGRGWNLENLALKQVGAAANNFQVCVNDLNNALQPGSTVAIYNPNTGVEGPHVAISEGAYVTVGYGTAAEWPIPNGVLRVYDDAGNFIDEHKYSPLLQAQAQVAVDIYWRRGLQPGEFDQSDRALQISDRGVQYQEAKVFADVPTFIPWRSSANPTNPRLVRGALEATNSPIQNIAVELAVAQRMYDMVTKIATIQKSSFDLLAGLIR